jgi:hypothetical protein
MRQTYKRGLWFALLVAAVAVLAARQQGHLVEWQARLSIALSFGIGAFLADLIVEALLNRHRAKHH